MKRFLPAFAAAFALSFAAANVVAVYCSTEAEAQNRPKRKRPKGKVIPLKKRTPKGYVGVRGGFIFQGQAESTLATSTNSTTATLDDESQFGLSFYGMLPIQKAIRVGLSTWLYPAWSLKEPGQPAVEDSFGWDINLIGEFLQKFQGIEGFLYGEGGFSIVFPPDVEQGQPEPSDLSGFNFGGGLGVNLGLGRKVYLRVDGKFSFYSLSGDIGGTDDIDIQGQRIMANAGVMFGL